MQKEQLIKKIIDYYLNSGDFNGINNSMIDESDKKTLISLIEDDCIFVISDKDVLNPHIYSFELNLSKKHQIDNLVKWNNQFCVYPTEKALEKLEDDFASPYTALLKKGKPQFKIIYFDIEILERYINNPKYTIVDYGYKGMICIKNEYWNEDSDSEYIKEYGMAYQNGTIFNRAVGVFLRDLSRLSPKIQMLWKGFEHKEQQDYRISEGFIKNSVYGAWVTTHWIFDAVLEEMNIINLMCRQIGIPCLFIQTYSARYDEKPTGYTNILLPTLKNYDDFTMLIEKMIIHNISIKTFMQDAMLIKAIDRKDESGRNKGSLTMLKEWLDSNVGASFDIDKVIIKPLKKIRKDRQRPAHEIYDNEFDISVYAKQKHLMRDVYFALKGIRVLLMGHPLAKSVEIPEYLLEFKDIVFY